MVNVPTLYRNSVTATSDDSFKLVPTDTWLEHVDIFILDNDAFIGDIRAQDAPLSVNGIWYTLTPINLNDYFFMNQHAGLNTRLVVVGTLLTDTRKKELGIPL